MRLLFVFCLDLLLSFNTFAYSKQRIFVSNIAVDAGIEIKHSELNSLNADLLIAIRRNIGKKYTLLDADNIEELLPLGESLENCVDNCIVSIGRKIQAHITVGSNLSKVDDYYLLYITARKTSNGEILGKERIKSKLFSKVSLKIKEIKILRPSLNLAKKIQAKKFDIEKCAYSLWKRNMNSDTFSFIVHYHLRGLVFKGEFHSIQAELQTINEEFQPTNEENSCLTSVLESISIDRIKDENKKEQKIFSFPISESWEKERDKIFLSKVIKLIRKKSIVMGAREAVIPRPVDFNRRGAKHGRFSRRAFDYALANRSGRLLKCIEAEHGRFPEKALLEVAISVAWTGRFLNARFVGGSGPGMECVFRAIQGLKISPFSGGDKTITLHYKVK